MDVLEVLDNFADDEGASGVGETSELGEGLGEARALVGTHRTEKERPFAPDRKFCSPEIRQWIALEGFDAVRTGYERSLGKS